mmetsp:Transcript_25163/g.61854  ORF Transcript_25163/g.61854 Transcript_25163/m.61854 type:complete len:296 (+) Transcript_25163:1711-2598(+)
MSSSRHSWEVLGISPEAVEHEGILDCLSVGWALPPPVDGPYVLNKDAVAAEEASVDDENAFRDDGGEGKELKELLKHHEHCRVVLVPYLVEEAAAVVDAAAIHLQVLVVPTVDHDPVRVQALVHQHNKQNLRRILTPIRHVTVEQVASCVARLAVLLQDPEEVGELPVRVSADHELAVGTRGHGHVVHAVLELLRHEGSRLAEDLGHVLLVDSDVRLGADVVQHLLHVGKGERPLDVWALVARLHLHLLPPLGVVGGHAARDGEGDSGVVVGGARRRGVVRPEHVLDAGDGRSLV